jgi:hypothetical protein
MILTVWGWFIQKWLIYIPRIVFEIDRVIFELPGGCRIALPNESNQFDELDNFWFDSQEAQLIRAHDKKDKDNSKSNPRPEAALLFGVSYRPWN